MLGLRQMFLPHPRVKVSIAGSLRDREVACSASDRQGSNFESCVWRTVSSQSSHHPQEVLLAQFSLYMHKGGLKPDSFHLPGVVMLLCTTMYDFSHMFRLNKKLGHSFGQSYICMPLSRFIRWRIGLLGSVTFQLLLRMLSLFSTVIKKL